MCWPRGPASAGLTFPSAVGGGLEEPMLYAYERRLVLVLGLGALSLLLNCLVILGGCAGMVYGALAFWR